ncbi:hypothetical protein AGOR_G00094560 [Albula goreensis]|uniref:HEG n=1 Tax=Albula goreensis TaxID=1534307 RepID=A0A8T3DM63_9TELE|nr:hypothetical protein AGOR_G00094560 [Albula goreensis]
MDMFVLKLVIFLWLMSTGFGQSVSPSSTTESVTPGGATVKTTLAAQTNDSKATATPAPAQSSTTAPVSPNITSKPPATGPPTTANAPPKPPVPTNASTPTGPPPIETTPKPSVTTSASKTTGPPLPATTPKPSSTTPTPSATTPASPPTGPPTAGTTPKPSAATLTPSITTSASSATGSPPPTTAAKPPATGSTPPATTPKPSATTPSPSVTNLPGIPNITSTINVTVATTPADNSSMLTTPGFNTTSVPPNITTQPSTTVPSACSSNPCPEDSTCVELFRGFTCQCFAGASFSGEICMPARVFAGNLTLKELEFEKGMENTNSQIFEVTAKKISETMKMAVGHLPGYQRTNVLTLRKGSVVATVDNVFNTTSNVTQEAFNKAFDDYTMSCGSNCSLLLGSTFKPINLCELNPAPCDGDTTECNYANGIATCNCKEGYINSAFSNRSCTACPSGEQAVGDKCTSCPFGYSGFNCNDSALLAVVVISCVLGGLLLILLLAFLIYCCRTSKQTSKGESSFNSPYPDQQTRSTWSNQQVPKIPRASANTGWDPSQLEMTESGSTRALVSKDRPGNGVMASYNVSNDDLRTFTGKDPTRYSYLVQGHDNPYFNSDEQGTK